MTSAVPEASVGKTAAAALLESIRSAPGMMTLTRVEGEQVPSGLFVRALTFSERMRLEAAKPLIESGWKALRASQSEEDVKAEMFFVGCGMALAFSLVAEDGSQVLVGDEPLPEGFRSLTDAMGGAAVSDDASDIWDAACRCMAYLTPPAIVALYKASLEAGYKREAALGKDLAAKPSPGS